MDIYKSLEHIIRDIAEQGRNTEARKKVVNVGRPDTAPSNLDPRSKLAKQGEIKTKIIDEEIVDESHKQKYADAPDHVKKVADDIAWIKKQPTDVLKRHADQTSKVHNAKTRDELRSVILSKHGNKNLAAHDKHFYGEETVIEAKDKKDDKSDDKPKGDTERTPEEKITFGKTEVELEPKTDDKVDNETAEKAASKKARKTANKEIGAKTMKEDKLGQFGLPQSLIDTVAEALKGGQKKLDKNHNGKLDKEDFKLLRKEESVEEEQITETSKPEVSVYDNAAHVKDKMGKVVASYSKKDHGADYMKKANAHMSKIKEEVEQIDEVSKGSAISAYRQKEGEERDTSKLHGLIKRKFGKETAKHAERAGAQDTVGLVRRGEDRGREDSIARDQRLGSAARKTKGGKIHRQDTSTLKGNIKRRLGTHTKPSHLPEEVEFSPEELAHIEAIMKKED